MSTDNDNDPNLAMRKRSGDVYTWSGLVAFFYELLRDDIPFGRFEELVRKNEAREINWHLTNGWMAEYAKDAVNRLLMSDRERDVLGFVESLLFVQLKDARLELNEDAKKIRSDAVTLIRRLRNQ